jgi:hypothetical protein
MVTVARCLRSVLRPSVEVIAAKRSLAPRGRRRAAEMPVMTMEAVLAVAVSPDGRRIVSGSGDTTLRSRNLEAGFWLRSWADGWIVAADGTFVGNPEKFALVRGNDSMPVLGRNKVGRAVDPGRVV